MTTIDFEYGSTAHVGRGRRGVLLFALVAIAAVAAAVVVGNAADASGALARDPELALLLRGMAVIKSLVVAAALGAVGWRTRHPIARLEAFGYAAATVAMSAATAAIWQLSWLVPAAVVFHLGLVGFLIVAWRDDRIRVRVPVGRPAAPLRS